MTVTISLILLTSSLFVLGSIVYLFFSQALQHVPNSNIYVKRTLKKRDVRLRKFKKELAYTAPEHFPGTLKQLFFLNEGPFTRGVPQRIQKHHMRIIRFLTDRSIGDLCALSNISNLQNLLDLHYELLNKQVELIELIRKNKRRINNPNLDWKSEDYTMKESELKREITMNIDAINSTLDSVLATLVRSPGGTKITFH